MADGEITCICFGLQGEQPDAGKFARVYQGF